MSARHDVSSTLPSADRSAAATSRRGSVSGNRPLAIAVLLAALLQAGAPLVTLIGPGASPGAGSGPELLITPAGWAFSIWGVIYLLAIASAAAVLAVGPERVSRRAQVDQLVLYVAAAVWIFVAGSDTSLGTAAVLAVMAIAAIDGVVEVSRSSIAPSWLQTLVRQSLGMFAGWVTAAFFLNASTALVDLGAFDADAVEWQIGVLMLAVAALAAVTLATRGLTAYAAAGLWALVGIAATALSDDTTGVLTTTVVAGVVLLGVLAVARARAR